MAVNEEIVTGRKFRKLIDEATKLWQRISFWTKASDVEFDDGSTAETKMGAINGITDSLVSTSSNIAASAKALNQLNNKLAHGQIEFNISSDGEGFWKAAGADTWIPFNSSNIVYAFMCLGTYQIHTENVDLPIGTYKVNADGFCVTTSLMSSGYAYVTVNGVNYGEGQTFTVNKNTVGTVKLGQNGWENHGSIIITRLLAKIV